MSRRRCLGVMIDTRLDRQGDERNAIDPWWYMGDNIMIVSFRSLHYIEDFQPIKPSWSELIVITKSSVLSDLRRRYRRRAA
ncbi:unnamed protein product [Hymenolepis diminuta]|uniref:C2 domain-containing protein n=1 Tax=Hymenolepis diminuta TaxID=6216 RepID=A0A0R3SAQ1_HYMDI|nr:unnamed protein product [Hymenolepis diminuta]